MSDPVQKVAGIADATFDLKPYGSRFWAVYEGETLVCVTVYKKGARSVIERLVRPMARADRAAV
jgi:hypothetical protein